MEQEKRQKMLAEYCKTRDVGLRNELVTEYMYLADMVARKYAGRGVEYDDLKQIAAMALIGALERFSCDKGIQFSTFAVPSMTGVVKNYFRDRSRIIRMPRTIGERVQKITLAREALTQELMRAPTPREIAERCGYSEADVLEATEAMQSLSLTSLDAQVGEEEDTPLASMLGQEEAEFENIALARPPGEGHGQALGRGEKDPGTCATSRSGRSGTSRGRWACRRCTSPAWSARCSRASREALREA